MSLSVSMRYKVSFNLNDNYRLGEVQGLFQVSEVQSFGEIAKMVL